MFSLLLGLASVTTHVPSDKDFARRCAVNMTASASSIINSAYSNKSRRAVQHMKYSTVEPAFYLNDYAQSILEQAGIYKDLKGVPDVISEEGVAKAKRLITGPTISLEDAMAAKREMDSLQHECMAVYHPPQPKQTAATPPPSDHRPECAANYKALAQVIVRSTQANSRLDKNERNRRTMLWSSYELRAVQLLTPGANLTAALPNYVTLAANRLSDEAMAPGDAGLQHVMQAVAACDKEFKLATIPLG